ncbi:MAG: NAD(P)/FAD-dependent oxidoreductase [Brevinemataceae bacterium]
MKYIVLGASAAGINGAEALRRLDPNAEIILISKDTEIYSRCMLHYYISGERSVSRLNFKSDDFFTKNNIKWISGKEVTEVNETEKTVLLDSGEELHFDKLLIASGASSRFPNIPNLTPSPYIVGVRTLDDCDRIKELSKKYKHAVVIGGGLIGADIITGLSHSEADIALIEVSSHMMNRQLDTYTAKNYQELWQKKGIKFYFDVSINGVILDKQNDKPEYIQINGSEKVKADFIVVALGVSPNIQFLKNSSIEKTQFDAIKVNHQKQTSHPDIYAAGDVTGTAAIWSVAVKEAIIAAHSMTGNELNMEDFFAAKSTMNFFGVPTMSLGQSNPSCNTMIPAIQNHEAGTYSFHSDDQEFDIDIQIDYKGNYKKIVHKNGKIYGALLQGDLSYSGILSQLIKENIDISKVKKSIFDISYADFFNITESLEYHFD